MSRSTTFRSIFGALLLILLAAASHAQQIDGTLLLRLNGALSRVRDQQPATRIDADLAMPCPQGVMSTLPDLDTRGYSGGRRAITLTDTVVDGRAFRFTATIDLAGDPWIKGGQGQYTVRGQVTPEGAITGQYAGTFQQVGQERVALEGTVTGTPVPFWPTLAKSAAFAAGEHPRLLFRKADIPLLRQRAETPQGRKLIADLEWRLEQIHRGISWGFRADDLDKYCATPYSEGYYLVGEAFLYTLTGDRTRLERAKELMRVCMGERAGEAGGWGKAPRTTGVAIAYDMLYNDLDEPFRQEMIGFFRTPGTGNVWGVTYDTFSTMFAASSMLCDLACLGDPSPEPAAPTAPDKALVIAPPAGFTPGEGVAVVPLVPDRIPAEMLYLGTFDENGQDALASVGGCAGIQPKVGMAIKSGNREATTRIMKANGLSYGNYYPRHPQQGLDMRLWRGWSIGVTEGKGDPIAPCTTYLYAVIQVDQPQVLIARPNMPDLTTGARMWIAGQEVKQNQIIRLDKGLYPLLMRVPVRGLFAAPNLGSYDYAAAQQAWKAEHDAWLADGKTVPGVSLTLNRRLASIRQTLDYRLGDHGYFTEQKGITDMRSELLEAASAYQAMFNAPLDPTGGLAWTIPLNMQMASNYWGNDWGGGFWPSYAFANLLPNEYRPALRWHIDRELAGNLKESWMFTQPNHDVYTFLNYPWELAPEQLTQPKEWALPKTFVDQKRGLYALRSGWDDRQDVTVTAHLQTGMYTSVYAGALQISGLGLGRVAGWADLGAGFFADPSIDESGMQVRISGLEPVGGARTSYFKAQEDGSAVLTMAIGQWGPSTTADGKPLADKQRRLPDRLTEPGVKSLRAVAVDYSGKSGATALIAIADKVTGANGRQITWQMPAGVRGSTSTLQGNVFTLTARDGVTFTAHLLGDGTPEWDARNGQLRVKGTGEFFTIITFQRGPAPKVEVQGTGLNAKITVGGQQVSFDGQKIVLGQ